VVVVPHRCRIKEYSNWGAGGGECLYVEPSVFLNLTVVFGKPVRRFS
jgi:hypothetical protein